MIEYQLWGIRVLVFNVVVALFNDLSSYFQRAPTEGMSSRDLLIDVPF